MKMRLIPVLLVCALGTGLMITGCSKQNETRGTTVVKGEQNGVLNHGHSIKETTDRRPTEIRRSGDVIMDQDEALKYLEDSVTLPDSDMRFVPGETSADDPGAYMWYGFYIYKDDICISNYRFDVIAFTDGTVCEGREEVLNCTSFADPDDTISPDEALAIYKQESGDSHDLYYAFNRNYQYNRKTNACILTYMYRYDNSRPGESYTLLLDAVTGEMVGYRPDEIT